MTSTSSKSYHGGDCVEHIVLISNSLLLVCMILYSSSVIFISAYIQMIFAISPLLLLGYILMTAFETDEQELKKRSKKSDFDMDGHAE